MLSARWLEKRKPYWTRLEEIIERAGRRGIARLSYAEMQELGQLYRQVASDLATVREDPLSRRMADYLNQLLARAHNLIYMGRRVQARGILHFYRFTFPQVFRATFNYTAAGLRGVCCGLNGGFSGLARRPGVSAFLSWAAYERKPSSGTRCGHTRS